MDHLTTKIIHLKSCLNKSVHRKSEMIQSKIRSTKRHILNFGNSKIINVLFLNSKEKADIII